MSYPVRVLVLQDLQRMLEDACEAADANALTLREQLRVYEQGTGANLAAGSLASVSKGSASHSFAFSDTGTVTTAELARGWRDLINLHDQVVTDFTASGHPTENADLCAEMRYRLPTFMTEEGGVNGSAGVRESTNDYSQLRYA